MAIQRQKLHWLCQRKVVASYNTGDDRKFWRVIKSLNGTPEVDSLNEALIYNDQYIMSGNRIADMFSKLCADDSKISIYRKEMTKKRNLKIFLHKFQGQTSPLLYFT